VRIPTGDFGLRAPGGVERATVAPSAFVQPGATDPAEGGLRMGAAAASDAATDAYLQNQEKRQQEAEAKQAFKESKRAEAMTLHAEGNNALGDLHDEIVTGLGAGTIKKEDAPRIWAERSKEVTDSYVDRADKANGELLKGSLAGSIGNFGRNINQAVTRRAQQDIGAQLSTTVEALQRTAERDLPNAIVQADMAIDSLGPQAGMNPEQIVKAKQGFKEAATFNKLNNEVIGARNNMKGLTALQAKIGENQDLDPAKRNALLNQTETQILNLQNKAEAAQRRREASATRAITMLDRQIAMGLPVDAKTWVATQTAVRGTEYAPLVDGMMKAEREVQTLLSKPIGEQIAYANAAEAKANTGAGGLQEKAYADRLKKTVAANVQLLTKSPLEYAVQRQGADATPLDMQNAGSWGDVLATRLAAVDPLTKQHGVPKRLLYPAEAAQFGQIITGSDTKTALTVFSALSKSVTDPKAFRDTVMQIAPDSVVAAQAGLAAGRGTTDDMKTAELMLRGQRALKPNSKEDGKGGGMMKMPEEKLLLSEFSDYERDAYAGKPEARNAVFQAAHAIYAARMVDKGDYSGVIDSSAWKDAMKRAVGTVEKYQGKAVVLPRDTDYSQFRDGVRTRIDALTTTGRLDPQSTAGRLRGLPLENIGDGRYVFRAGDGVLADNVGQPVVIDFNEPAYAPAAPVRRGKVAGFGDSGGGAATGVTR